MQSLKCLLRGQKQHESIDWRSYWMHIRQAEEALPFKDLNSILHQPLSGKQSFILTACLSYCQISRFEASKTVRLEERTCMCFMMALMRESKLLKCSIYYQSFHLLFKPQMIEQRLCNALVIKLYVFITFSFKITFCQHKNNHHIQPQTALSIQLDNKLKFLGQRMTIIFISQMSRRYQIPSQLSPWAPEIDSVGLDTIDRHIARVDKAYLPRVTNNPNKNQTLHKTKAGIQRFGLPLKKKPLYLQFEANKQAKDLAEHIAEAHKTRTLSFDPPVISMYNKKHPKLARRHARKAKSDYQSLDTSEQKQGKMVRIMSRIELTCQQDLGPQAQLTHHSSRQPSNKQFAKKRSLMDIVRFMRNEHAAAKHIHIREHKNFHNHMISIDLHAHKGGDQLPNMNSQRYSDPYKDISSMDGFKGTIPSWEKRRRSIYRK